MLFRNKPNNLSALDVTEPYDVCIIGSGPAGTIAATDLVEKGIKTLLIESGTGLLDWVTGTKLKSLAAYDFTGNTDYPLTQTKARLLGGNSNFWTGRCERLHPADFEPNPYTPDGNPWPITYEDLDPYYEIAERTLRVRGGERSQYAPPRKNPLPVPPKPDISYLTNLFSRIGVTVDDTPTATPTKTLRFFNVQKEVLTRFQKSSYGTLVSGCTVTKLDVNDNRQIVGAEVRTLAGIKKKARAKIYIVCCGGIESPRLLLLSKSSKFQNGIGNMFDMVGRGFNEHPAVNFYSKINHELGTLTLTNKIARTHQFYNDYRHEGLGSILPVYRQAWILPHHVMPLRAADIPKKIVSFFSRFARATLYIGATIEMKIDDNNRVMLSSNRKDMFGNPLAHLHFNYSQEDLDLLDRCRTLACKQFDALKATNIVEAEVTWSRHHQGTCRMGDNPKKSVVDKNLMVHDCSNLYVGGCEVFVTGGAMQPVLTLAALSHRLAEHITHRIKERN